MEAVLGRVVVTNADRRIYGYLAFVDVPRRLARTNPECILNRRGRSGEMKFHHSCRSSSLFEGKITAEERRNQIVDNVLRRELVANLFGDTR